MKNSHKFFFITFLLLHTVSLFAAANNTIKVKLINRTERAIRVYINDEEDIFGIGKKPVLYVSIPYGSNTKFAFAGIEDADVTRKAFVQSVVDGGNTFV